MRALVLGRLAISMIVGVLVLTGCGGASPDSPSDGRLTVDLIYLNHEPMRPIIKQVDEVLDKHADQVRVKRYDADSPEGQEFAQSHGLTGHVPFALLIDGDVEAKLASRTVRFQGFPKGQSPVASAEGEWTLEDLDAVLSERTA